MVRAIKRSIFPNGMIKWSSSNEIEMNDKENVRMDEDLNEILGGRDEKDYEFIQETSTSSTTKRKEQKKWNQRETNLTWRERNKYLITFKVRKVDGSQYSKDK